MKNTHLKSTWETYVSSWKENTYTKQEAKFKESLAKNCTYSDPLATTQGWQALSEYMEQFNQQIPGGHFVTTHFMAYSQKSIAKWEMRNGEGVPIGEGITYGEYNDEDKLVAMTGFYETQN